MASPARSGRRRQEHANDISARDQLLAAAGELMIERNSTEISLSDIAQKSGLNTALVKYYFGNKSGLLMALLRVAFGPAKEQLEHLCNMPIKPQEKLRIHLSGMINSYFRYPYANRLTHQMLADDPEEYGPRIVEEFSKPVAEAQRKILEEGIEAGCFRPVDPILFYFHVSGACDSLFYGRYQLKHIFGLTAVNEDLKRRYSDHLYTTILSGILLPQAASDAAPGSASN